MKKRISLFLAVVMLFGCVLSACKKAPVPPVVGGQTNGYYGTMVADKFIVQQGTPSYVVVLPAEAMDQETFAAEELVTFMEKATGCTLTVVSDTAVPAGSKYISLGRTSQFSAAFAGQDLTALEKTFSSYFIGSKDDNIYIVSGDDYRGYGVLYGVYDLMHDLIGYTYYHNDEIYVANSQNVNLWQYTPTVVEADFDMRTHSTAYIYTNELHNIRLRYINFSRGDEWNATTIGHSQVSVFISPLDYGADHPEWFVDPNATTVSKSANQLCWTAGGDPESLNLLQDTIAEMMLEFIMIDDLANFFMFGQQDTEYTCLCDSCKAALNEWGGSNCGLQIAFTNKVIEKTEALLEQNGIDREIFYAVYAYKPTEAAPVKTDESGNLVPYSDKVIPHEKMRIFFAPIRTNYGFPFDAPMNADAYKNLQGWDVVCDKDQLMAYVYDLNVRYYLANFYNYTTLGSMYTDLKEAGVSYLLSQGVSDGNTICFDELRAYCISRLMWDTTLNFNDLASDFIDHYYKDAAEAMQTLFDMITDQNAYHIGVNNPGGATPDGILYDTELYPRAFVEKMDEQIFAAMDAIAYLESTDPEQYQLLKARIMKEYLSNIYLKMSLYKNAYSESEIEEMRQIWNEYIAYWNITKGGEGNDLGDIF